MACHTVYYGLRGVGKTVLLTKIEELIGNMEGYYEHIESGNLAKNITIATKKFINKMSLIAAAKDLLSKAMGTLKAFTLTWNPKNESYTIGLNGEVAKGTADTGDLSNDLTELFIAVGELAKRSQKCICFFLDEMQDYKPDELSALIIAVHRTNQLQLPVIIVGAGLPTILRISSEAKSYSERLFNFVEITYLKDGAEISALVEPAKMLGVEYTADAVQTIIEKTGGYPYFIQLFGQCAWDHIEDNIINMNSANIAYDEYLKILDESFFSARFNRTTPSEKEFLFAMGQCKCNPCQMSQVAIYMDKKQSSISPLRAQLMSKGLIFAPSHGEVGFTVPQFDQFLQRVKTAQ